MKKKYLENNALWKRILVIALVMVMLAVVSPFASANSDASSCYVESLSEESESSWVSFIEGVHSPKAPDWRILTSSPESIVIQVTVYGMEVREENVNGEIFQMINIPNCGHLTEVGKAELPALRELVAIPQSADVNLEILNSKYKILSGYTVYPVQEPLRENEQPGEFTINKHFYFSNRFYPLRIAEFYPPGIMRDYRIIQLQLNPIQFYPCSHELRVSSEITMELRFSNAKLSTSKEIRPMSKTFESIYSHTILNYDSAPEDWRIRSSRELGGSSSYGRGDLKDPNNRADYIILTYHSYYNSILPLADAKERRALEVMIVNDTEVYDQFPNADNVESIHDFLSYAYQNWALPPSYVEIIGDIGDIPMYLHSGDPGDHYYSCVDPSGNVYPDICVGRISAQSNSEVELIRDKIINYGESAPGGEWLDKIMLVAHQEGAPGKYQGCKEEIRTNIIEQSPQADRWIVDTQYAYEGSSKQDVINGINEGRATVNYRGHGSSTAWASSNGLNTNDVMNLENGNMLPVVHSIACYNNQIDYSGGDCLGEAFLKSPNGGAISHLSASRPSYTIQNHDFDKYLFEATYMDEVQCVGEVINIAKIDLLNQYGTGGAAETNNWMYFQLGDPETPLASFQPPDHDIAVKNLVAPAYALADEITDIGATVFNIGSYNETNIEVQFLVDSIVEDSTIIGFLASGDSTYVSFQWTPTANGVYTVGIKSLPVSGEENLNNNEVYGDVIVGPDIGVFDLEAPEHTEPNEDAIISATVKNLGKSDESDIEVQLLIDKVVNDTTIIDFLASGDSTNVSFTWTPAVEGTYLVEIYAVPLVDEPITSNNNQSKYIDVFETPGVVLVDDGHGNDGYHGNYYQDLEDRYYIVDHTTETITLQLLSNYDVFISTEASYSYSTSEQTAIKDYVKGGGGLFVIGDDYPSIYNTLTDYAGIEWNGASGSSGVTNYIEEHPITENVSQIYFSSPSESHILSGTANYIVLDSNGATIQVSASSYDSGKIVGLIDDNCLDNSNLDQYDNRQFGRNVVSWLSKPIEEHDLAVSQISAPDLMETNTATTVEAKLSNIGKNDETNITVQFLVDQSVEDSTIIDFLAAGELTWVSFPWIPQINGLYTVGIKAIPLPNENITSNNLDEKEVVVTMYPIADAGPDQESFEGRSVDFDGSNSYDPDGTIVEYKWEFGDGSIGYGQTTSHAYSTYGVYNVILTVKDDLGAIGTDTATVTIWQDGHDLSILKVQSPHNVRMGSTKTVVVWVENVGTHNDYGFLSLTITAPDGTKTTLTEIVKDRDGTSINAGGKVKVRFSVAFNQRGTWTFHAHVDISDSNGNINPFPLKDCNPSNDDAEPRYATNCR